MSNTVTLSREDVLDIEQLVEDMKEKGTFRARQDWKSQKGKERDWLAGIASQKAVSKFLEETYDVSTEVDTRAYDDVEADSGDLWTYGSGKECNSCEIKKTKDYSNHVAITRAEMLLIEEDEPIVYVKTGWSGDPMELPTEFEVVGWCLPEDLTITEQGEKPWTEDADNWCQPLSSMRQDWVEFLDRVCPDASPERFTFSSTEPDFTFTD